MTDVPYEITIWCHPCDDYIVAEVLDYQPDFSDSVDHVEKFLEENPDLPCGHTFDEATHTGGESEISILKKKIAQKKRRLDDAQHPYQIDALKRDIRELLRDLEDARSESGGDRE